MSGHWVAWTASAADDKRLRCKCCGQFADEDGYCTTIDCVRCGKTRGICAGVTGEKCVRPRAYEVGLHETRTVRYCEDVGVSIVYSPRLGVFVHAAGREARESGGQEVPTSVARRAPCGA